MRFVARFLICLALAVGLTGAAWAASSTNYRIEEDEFGAASLINESSTNFQGAGSEVGGIGVGNSASANYQTNSGLITDQYPGLTFVVNTSTVNFGTLSTSVATTATSTFSVRNYTSNGYIVQIVGNPPTMGNHALAALSPKAPSQVGTEQFGINLVANTSPVSFGSNPQQIPDSTFSFGTAEAGDTNNTGYAKPDNYRYVSGETIAKSVKSSGQTNYTISYLVNASTATPGGSYTGSLQLVCTGTY